MKHINKHPEYAAASAQLDQLVSALTGAESEYDRLTTALSKPEEKATALETAKAMLSGQTVQRADTAGMNRQRIGLSDKLVILRRAVPQQRVIVGNIRDELSLEVNRTADKAHGEAVKGIGDALAELVQAVATEQAQRDAIEAAGYRCTLPVMTQPALDILDPQSLIQQWMRQSQIYATDIADRASGRLDKPAIVKLLVKCEHGEPGDVVAVPGLVARMLHRLSRVEPTTEKPRRVPRIKRWESLVDRQLDLRPTA